MSQGKPEYDGLTRRELFWRLSLPAGVALVGPLVGCVAASANTSPLVWTYQAQLNPTSAHFHDEVEEGRLHLLGPVGRALRHDDDVAFN